MEYRWGIVMSVEAVVKLAETRCRRDDWKRTKVLLTEKKGLQCFHITDSRKFRPKPATPGARLALAKHHRERLKRETRIHELLEASPVKSRGHDGK